MYHNTIYFGCTQNKIVFDKIYNKGANKSMFKKAISSVLVACLLCTPLFSVSAATPEMTPESSEAVSFLDTYLSNLQNHNIDEAYQCMEDTRNELNPTIDVTSLSTKELSYIDYVESGEEFTEAYEKEAIEDYAILEEKSDGIIITELTLKNGDVATVPFCVVSEDGHYKIKITTDDIDELGYSLDKSSENNSSAEITPYSDIWKDSYEFSYLYGTIYGIDSFSVKQNGVRISGYQANDALETGWTAKAEVIYAIVVKHWYGDSVWATTTNAIVKNGSFSVTLVGKNSDESDLRIRITNTTEANPRSKGNGSIYSVSV